MMSIKNIVRITAPLGVAFALVLVGTIPAFAAWGDSTFAVWRDISATSPMVPGNSPHGEYDTASQKCKVCHAVHGANPAGDRLLASTASYACVYCHIDAKVSDYVVYDGVVSNYAGTDYDRGHNTGYAGSANGGCIDCHQVHAASSKMTANQFLADKILIGDKEYSWFDENYDWRAEAPLFDDPEATALSKWCTKCHNSAPGYSYYFKEGDIDPTSHVMKAPSSTYALGSGETTTVAFSTSEECSSCHRSGFGTSSWPHYTAGARFLVSAQKDGDPMLPVESGKTGYDGVCLRCHTDGTTGVGVTW